MSYFRKKVKDYSDEAINNFLFLKYRGTKMSHINNFVEIDLYY